MENFDEIRFIRLSDVLKIVPIGRATLWRKIKKGEFPKPYNLGERAVGWKYSEVVEWINKILKNYR